MTTEPAMTAVGRPRLVERYRPFLPLTDATPDLSLGDIGLRCGDGRWRTRGVNNFGEAPGKVWLGLSAIGEFDRFNLAEPEGRSRAVAVAKNHIELHLAEIGSYRFHVDPHALEYVQKEFRDNAEFSLLNEHGVEFGSIAEVHTFINSPRVSLGKRGLSQELVQHIFDTIKDPLIELLLKREAKGCGRLLVYSDNEGQPLTAHRGSMDVLYQAALELLFEQDKYDYRRFLDDPHYVPNSNRPRIRIDNVELDAHLEGAVIEHRHLDTRERDLIDPSSYPVRVFPNSAHGIMAFGIVDGRVRKHYRDEVVRLMHARTSRDMQLEESLQRAAAVQKVVDTATVEKLAKDLPSYVVYSASKVTLGERRAIVE